MTDHARATAAWAATIIARAPGAPWYGTPAWHALPPRDPRRWAATAAAAQALRDLLEPDPASRDREVIRERLHAELLLARRAMRGASLDVAGAHDWVALAATPTHADLEARREGAA